MTDPAHPIHRGGTLTGQKLRDAIMQQTEVVGGPGILVNYVNGKVVVSLKRQVVPRVAGAPGQGSDVFMGKIMEVAEPGGFNTTYMIQNLAETLTTPDGPPGGCTPSVIPGRCEGIPYVTPYNRFFDSPQVASVDFHAAEVDDWVIVGKVKAETGGQTVDCNLQPGQGKCVCANGDCFDGADSQLVCDLACNNNGTFTAGACCDDEDPAPAEYAIWITEDVKISTCPNPALARTGNVPDFAPTILPPPQLIGRVQ